MIGSNIIRLTSLTPEEINSLQSWCDSAWSLHKRHVYDLLEYRKTTSQEIKRVTGHVIPPGFRGFLLQSPSPDPMSPWASPGAVHQEEHAWAWKSWTLPLIREIVVPFGGWKTQIIQHPPGTQLSPHADTTHRIHVCIDSEPGNFIVDCLGQEYSMKSGDVVYLDATRIHSTTTSVLRTHLIFRVPRVK